MRRTVTGEHTPKFGGRRRRAAGAFWWQMQHRRTDRSSRQLRGCCISNLVSFWTALLGSATPFFRPDGAL